MFNEVFSVFEVHFCVKIIIKGINVVVGGTLVKLLPRRYQLLNEEKNEKKKSFPLFIQNILSSFEATYSIETFSSRLESIYDIKKGPFFLANYS